ncbi:MAG: class II fructose-bisphosphate aldolase [Peptococcaceae bacterium]
MSYISLLQTAKRNSYAVGAFNFHNLEVLQGIIAAAEEMSAPVIVQTTPPYIKDIGLKTIAAVAKEIIAESSVPVALHLDHSNSFELVQKCLVSGFTSVMIDGSKLPFAQNIKLTKKVVEITKAVEEGIGVEAELGSIGGVEDQFLDGGSGDIIDPEEAVKFVEETGIDALAPAIGTAHGIYKSEPQIRFDVAQELNRIITIPLVLHGGSGLDERTFQKLIRLGFSKVNVGTELKIAWYKALENSFQNGRTDPLAANAEAKKAVKEAVINKIKIFGSEGKAGDFLISKHKISV